jgi:3-dehydroquinate dehydratase
MTAAATGMITGLGPHGYVLAVRHIAKLLGK